MEGEASDDGSQGTDALNQTGGSFGEDLGDDDDDDDE